MMIGIVDRFEGDYAVIEIDGTLHDIERALVDQQVGPGDVVELIDERWVKNIEETKLRSVEIKKLMDDVWED